MRIEYPNKEFLFDGSGDHVTFNPIVNAYSALTYQGYKITDLNWNKKVSINKKDLQNDFEPMEDTGILNYSKTSKFSLFYQYWYHIELDFYIILTKGSEGIRDYYRDDDDEDDDETSEYLKVGHICYKYENIQKVYEYLNEVMEDNLSSDNKIDIIIQTQSGYEFREHTIKPLELDIDTMYNDDFKDIHEHILEKLNNSDKGIILLHGIRGSGKSNYLKWLTRQVKSKFVFVPINMIGHISSPAFIGDLIDNKGSILVIEDCEQYIQDRRGSDTSIVSPLLQLTDGFLSDIVNIKIIATFNDDSAKVDPALKREGRLIAEYEFDKLKAPKVSALTDGEYNEDMTLAEIYNTLTYKKNQKKETKIGFGLA